MKFFRHVTFQSIIFFSGLFLSTACFCMEAPGVERAEEDAKEVGGEPIFYVRVGKSMTGVFDSQFNVKSFRNIICGLLKELMQTYQSSFNGNHESFQQLFALMKDAIQDELAVGVIAQGHLFKEEDATFIDDLFKELAGSERLAGAVSIARCKQLEFQANALQKYLFQVYCKGKTDQQAEGLNHQILCERLEAISKILTHIKTLKPKA